MVLIYSISLMGKILEILKSKYENANSRVKCCNEISSEFICSPRVRQGKYYRGASTR